MTTLPFFSPNNGKYVHASLPLPSTLAPTYLPTYIPLMYVWSRSIISQRMVGIDAVIQQNMEYDDKRTKIQEFQVGR